MDTETGAQLCCANLGGMKKHSQIHAGGEFGVLKWSNGEDQLVYLAERTEQPAKFHDADLEWEDEEKMAKKGIVRMGRGGDSRERARKKTLCRGIRSGGSNTLGICFWSLCLYKFQAERKPHGRVFPISPRSKCTKSRKKTFQIKLYCSLSFLEGFFSVYVLISDLKGYNSLSSLLSYI